jgi:hypothetical protein
MFRNELALKDLISMNCCEISHIAGASFFFTLVLKGLRQTNDTGQSITAFGNFERV